MKIELELDYLEMNQLEAALLNRLSDAALAERRMTPGTIEADMVVHEVRYTGSALTKVQLALHGSDEPDEPVWGALASLVPANEGITETEFRALWGDR